MVKSSVLKCHVRGSMLKRNKETPKKNENDTGKREKRKKTIDT